MAIQDSMMPSRCHHKLICFLIVIVCRQAHWSSSWSKTYKVTKCCAKTQLYEVLSHVWTAHKTSRILLSASNLTKLFGLPENLNVCESVTENAATLHNLVTIGYELWTPELWQTQRRTRQTDTHKHGHIFASIIYPACYACSLHSIAPRRKYYHLPLEPDETAYINNIVLIRLKKLPTADATAAPGPADTIYNNVWQIVNERRVKGLELVVYTYRISQSLHNQCDAAPWRCCAWCLLCSPAFHQSSGGGCFHDFRQATTH